jgi:hypothetical protein
MADPIGIFGVFYGLFRDWPGRIFFLAYNTKPGCDLGV